MKSNMISQITAATPIKLNYLILISCKFHHFMNNCFLINTPFQSFEVSNTLFTVAKKFEERHNTDFYRIWIGDGSRLSGGAVSNSIY